MTLISDASYRLLRDYVQERCGIVLGDGAQRVLETRLSTLLRDEACAGFDDLARRIHGEKSARLRDRITEALSAGEMTWFRDGAPYKAFRELLLPAWAKELRTGRREKIRVWSAACGAGQEPYSLAICWLDFIGERRDLDPEALEILATDISIGALEQAQGGCYDSQSIATGLPEAYRRDFFRGDGRHWKVLSKVKERVRFEPFNLMDDATPFGRFDAVFSRYVACYYTDAFKRRLYRGLRKALKPGGGLFIGASEILGDHATGFDLCEHGSARFYRLRDSRR